LRSWLPEADESLLQALLSHIAPALATLKERAARNLFVGDGAAHKQKQRVLEDEANQLWQLLQVLRKGNERLGAAEEQEALDRHLLRSVGSDLINVLLQGIL
jgi:hypothetical protein